MAVMGSGSHLHHLSQASGGTQGAGQVRGVILKGGIHLLLLSLARPGHTTEVWGQEQVWGCPHPRSVGDSSGSGGWAHPSCTQRQTVTDRGMGQWKERGVPVLEEREY